MVDDPLNRLRVKRGSALPQAKLNEVDVRQIRELVAHRDNLRKLAGELTNAKIAEKFGVHQRTIDRITGMEGWTHV